MLAHSSRQTQKQRNCVKVKTVKKKVAHKSSIILHYLIAAFVVYATPTTAAAAEAHDIRSNINN